MSDSPPMYISGSVVFDIQQGGFRKLRVMNGPAQWLVFLKDETPAGDRVGSGTILKCWVVKKVDSEGVAYYEVTKIVGVEKPPNEFQ